MPSLDIGEVARISGVPPSTLRYYEEVGLLRSVGRRGLRRLFPESVLERLAFIALGRAAGFSLAEIGTLFSNKGHPHVDRNALTKKRTNSTARFAA